MLLAADSGQVTGLCLLDLTAAFDIVDHDLLMLCLERQFGIHVPHLSGFIHTCKADRSMSSTVVPCQPWFTLSVLYHKDRFLVPVYSFCIRRT